MMLPPGRRMLLYFRRRQLLLSRHFVGFRHDDDDAYQQKADQLCHLIYMRNALRIIAAAHATNSATSPKFQCITYVKTSTDKKS